MRVGWGSCWTLLLAVLLLAACDAEVAVRGPDADSAAEPDAVTTPDATTADGQDVAQLLDTVNDAAGEVSADATACPGGAGCPCLSADECNDGDPCTYGQDCVAGLCSAGLAEPCADDLPCTTDRCEPDGSCSHEPRSGWCEDGDPCTVADTCDDAVCVAGPPDPCVDNSVCTDDLCTPGLGCLHIANTAECGAENACIEASFCALGSCPPGKAKPCQDNDPCTWDTCDPVSGCELYAVPDPAPCPDGAVTAHGRCWLALPGDASWTAARITCRQAGMELASIANRYENDTARAVATTTCGDVAAWIGLSDRGREGNFVWSDDRGARFNNWNSGEPNNWPGEPSGEDVTELGVDGGWNDLGLSAVRGCAVCARPLQSSCDDSAPCTTGDLCSDGQCQLGPVDPCDDANACTLDSCTLAAKGSGCQHTAIALPDGPTVTCGAGTCAGNTCSINLANDPTSCAVASPDAMAVVALDPDGPNGPLPSQWHRCWPGGWTQALAVSGSDAYGHYGSPLWTDTTAGGDPFDLLATSKTHAFWTHPVSQLRLGLRWQGVMRWIDLPLPATATAADGSVVAVAGQTLQTLFSAEVAVDSQMGLLAWEALMGQGSLQSHCHQEGLHAGPVGGIRVRIGIVGNNEPNCDSIDSWIGAGGPAGLCNTSDTPTAGNVACYSADWGSGTRAAVAYVLVR